MKRIHVALADDSAFVRKAIQRLLERVPEVGVVGAAASGEELLQNIPRWRPEAVILDLSMPGMGGLAVLDRLMQDYPVPVIILSTHSSKDAPLTIEALNRGAVDFIDKQQYSLLDFDALRTVLLEKILAAVAGAAPHPAAAASPAPVAPVIPARPVPVSTTSGEYQVVLIGASTGGPPAIETVLQDLGHGIDLPILVVQHMPEGFTRAFAARLDSRMPFPVREADHGEQLLGRMVYIAPAGKHLKVQRNGDDSANIVLSDRDEDQAHKPSVDVLFRSAASVFGRRAVAVLMTGMGRDGAAGMEELMQAGAYTMAQDQASSVVYGMPGAAVMAGAVCEEVSLDRIGGRILQVVGAAAYSGRSK